MTKQFSKLIRNLIILILLINIFMFNQVVYANEFPFSNQESAIHIIDPENDKVITTIIPKQYHIELDFLDYRNQIKIIVNRIANGSSSKSGYNRAIVLDRLDPVSKKVIKGKPKIAVDEEKLIEKIVEQSFSGGKVYVPVKTIESGYEEDDAPYLSEVVLASYTTYFNPLRQGRSKNIELSAASINNVIVGSGDIFSFNDTVGPRDVASGYQEAPEFIKGKIVIGIGGGICQTSSTLFNAVDKLGMDILERHRHTRDIGYVPKGRDATVSFGGLDFTFQNTLGIPVLIKTYYGKGSITIQVRTSKEHAYMLKNLED